MKLGQGERREESGEEMDTCRTSLPLPAPAQVCVVCGSALCLSLRHCEEGQLGDINILI